MPEVQNCGLDVAALNRAFAQLREGALKRDEFRFAPAIEPISAHSRESGNPDALHSAEELGPRFRGDERN